MTPEHDPTPHQLPVRQVTETLPDVHGHERRLTLLLAIDDPEVDEEVLVRWRVPEYPASWLWRCVTCSVKTRDAHACRHTFAAALHLATTLLGLQALGVVNTHPTPDPEGHAA